MPWDCSLAACASRFGCRSQLAYQFVRHWAALPPKAGLHRPNIAQVNVFAASQALSVLSSPITPTSSSTYRVVAQLLTFGCPTHSFDTRPSHPIFACSPRTAFDPFSPENVVLYSLILLPSERVTATPATAENRPVALPSSHFFSNSESFACKMA